MIRDVRYSIHHLAAAQSQQGKESRQDGRYHRRLFHHVLGAILYCLPDWSILWQLYVAGGLPRVLLARLLQLGRQSLHLRSLFARLPLRLHQLPALRVRADAQRAGESGERSHDGSFTNDDHADRRPASPPQPTN